MAKHRKTTSTVVRYVRCSTLKERDELMGYAVRRGASCVSVRMDDELLVALFPGRYVASMSAVHPGSVEVSVERFRRMVRDVFPSKAVLARREAAERRIVKLDEMGQVHAKVNTLLHRGNEQKGQLDRLEMLLLRLDKDVLEMRNAIITETNAILASLSQPIVEQAAPQPEGLKPGDYTDASKETADALTAMGFKPMTGTTYLHNFVGWAHGGVIEARGGLIAKGYITPSTFLSRAAVTAKEIGLVPVEPWVPKSGDYVKRSDKCLSGFEAQFHPLELGQVGVVKAVWGDRISLDGVPDESNDFYQWRFRPATDAEIAAHLAEQEARANAEKLAKLKAMKPGTPIKVKGKKQCTFIATENECLVWYAHSEDESYYAALCGASDITVIDPQP